MTPERTQSADSSTTREDHLRVWDTQISVDEIRSYLLREISPLLRANGIDASNLHIYPAVVPSDQGDSLRVIECTLSDKICVRPTTLYAELLRNPAETLYVIRKKIIDALSLELPQTEREALLHSVTPIDSAVDALRCWQGMGTEGSRTWFALPHMQLPNVRMAPSLPPGELRKYLFSAGHNPRSTRSIRVPPFRMHDAEQWFRGAQGLAEYIEADILRDVPGGTLIVWADPADPWTLHVNAASARSNAGSESAALYTDAPPQENVETTDTWSTEQKSYSGDEVEKGTQQVLEATLESMGLAIDRIVVLPGKLEPSTKDVDKERDYLCEFPIPLESAELQLLCGDVQRYLEEDPAGKVFICIRTTADHAAACLNVYRSRRTPAS
jgi:hypothetical protein